MISVCLATYNGSNFIERQLTSIVSQLTTSDEIVIVDDCSTDDTIAIIERMHLPQVQVFKNAQNMGVIKSFEYGLSQCHGDIIFLSDQDDVWLPNKVKNVMEIFDQNPSVKLVLHDGQVVDNNLGLIANSWMRHKHLKASKSVQSIIIKNYFTGCMMAFKPEIREISLPFPNSIEMHDQWIGITTLINDPDSFYYLDQPLIQFVRHGSNLTDTHNRPLSVKIMGRLKLIWAILQYRLKRVRK